MHKSLWSDWKWDRKRMNHEKHSSVIECVVWIRWPLVTVSSAHKSSVYCKRALQKANINLSVALRDSNEIELWILKKKTRIRNVIDHLKCTSNQECRFCNRSEMAGRNTNQFAIQSIFEDDENDKIRNAIDELEAPWNWFKLWYRSKRFICLCILCAHRLFDCSCWYGGFFFSLLLFLENKNKVLFAIDAVWWLMTCIVCEFIVVDNIKIQRRKSSEKSSKYYKVFNKNESILGCLFVRIPHSSRRCRWRWLWI